MTKQHIIDAAEAALISRNIRDTGVFLEELLADPSSVEQIPSGSTPVFRVIQVLDERFRLTAYRPSRSDDEWPSRVTSRTSLAGGANGAPRQEPEVANVVGHGKTADDALDALEAAVRDRIPSAAPKRPS